MKRAALSKRMLVDGKLADEERTKQALLATEALKTARMFTLTTVDHAGKCLTVTVVESDAVPFFADQLQDVRLTLIRNVVKGLLEDLDETH